MVLLKRKQKGNSIMEALLASTTIAGGIRVELYEGSILWIINGKTEIKLTAEGGLDLLNFLAEQASIMNARLEDDYGPAAHISEHKRGQHVKYILDKDHNVSGEILWVCAARDLPNGQHIGISYVIAPDEGGFVDVVMPADVIAD
jgi:hypothetical protein